MLAILLLLGILSARHASAEEVLVAVASNFAGAIEEIAERFAAEQGHELAFSLGSTGKHYAQIVNGAPFAVFLAADRERPERLEAEGRVIAGTRFTYALGKLVLFSPDPDRVDAEGNVLEQGTFRYLALANPKLAPYGRAAREVLDARGLWHSLERRIVRGENVGQALHLVLTGNAELGFVARSQVEALGKPSAGSWWEVPTALYSPIEQQAVLLVDDGPARQFLEFLRGSEARSIIRRHGYGAPHDR